MGETFSNIASSVDINKKVVIIQPGTCCTTLLIPLFLKHSMVFLHNKLK
jgi:hypothetical protein